MWRCSADGTTLTFNTSSNGLTTVQASGLIGWASNTWHQVVVGIWHKFRQWNGPVNVRCGRFCGGFGGMVTNWTGLAMLNQGFAVGSDIWGGWQMRGVLADFETYNYTPEYIDTWVDEFNAVETGANYSVSFASRYTSNALARPH